MPLKLIKEVNAASPLSDEAQLGRSFFEYRTDEDLGNVFQNTVDFFFFLSYVICVIFIAVSGLKFITSAGDKGKLDSAKDSLKYSIIALAGLVLFNLILTYLIQIFGGGTSTIFTPEPLDQTNP